MKRFQKRHRIRLWIKALRRFISKNGQLLFLIGILLIGAVLGVAVHKTISHEHPALLSPVNSITHVPSSFIEGCKAVVSSALGISVVLIGLFLLGLTAFGCPIILLLLMLFGFWIGVCECQSFSLGGLWYTAFTVLLPMYFAGIAVLLGTKQALHMSFVFSRQLLPTSAHCGSMWADFKTYLLHFILCLFLVIVAAVANVITNAVYSVM